MVGRSGVAQDPCRGRSNYRNREELDGSGNKGLWLGMVWAVVLASLNLPKSWAGRLLGGKGGRKLEASNRAQYVLTSDGDVRNRVDAGRSRYDGQALSLSYLPDTIKTMSGGGVEPDGAFIRMYRRELHYQSACIPVDLYNGRAYSEPFIGPSGISRVGVYEISSPNVLQLPS